MTFAQGGREANTRGKTTETLAFETNTPFIDNLSSYKWGVSRDVTLAVRYTASVTLRGQKGAPFLHQTAACFKHGGASVGALDGVATYRVC